MKEKIKLTFHDYINMSFLGLVNIVVSMGLIQYGLLYANASVCAILFSINPLFVVIFARLIEKEKITANKLIGLFLGIAGVILLFYDSLHNKTSNIVGLLLILSSAICFSFYTVMGKRITNHMQIGSLIVTSISFIIGSILLIPIRIINGDSLIPDTSGILLYVLYMSIVVTGIAYVFYFNGLSIIGAGLGSMMYFAKPALASLLSVIILGEIFTINMIVGIIIIGIGIFSSQILNKKGI
jgi:drug/metabolite transporter (DMT)-like permease